jgi:calcineurin-like phosphoesterase family protein
MRYYIADLHDMDPNMICYYRRPFDSVEEQHRVFVNNWNDTVKPEDEVYLVGDIGDYNILHELNGKIIVVTGNHDDAEKLRKMFPDLEINTHPIMVGNMWLSHKPITYMPPEVPYLNIHGHIHSMSYGPEGKTWGEGNRYFCVSVEQIGYKPISEEEIAKKIEYIW